MAEPDFSKAIAHALARLRTELAPTLTYHSFWHTVSDVVPAVVRLAHLCDLPEPETRLLEVAAAYHDVGFVVSTQEHERTSAVIAARILPDFGFSPGQVEQVTGMIMATRLPQSPRNLLASILADADLDVLGRSDFFERNRLLWQEVTALGQPRPWRQWQVEQLRFLQRHTYFTPVAQALREATKQAHIARLKAELDKA